jgi:hypothetical protein
MFDVVQVRHTLQHTVAIGACSTARFTTGSTRMVVRSNTPEV